MEDQCDLIKVRNYIKKVIAAGQLFLLCTPILVFAQWNSDTGLTLNKSTSLSYATCWDVAANGNFAHIVWAGFCNEMPHKCFFRRIYYKRSIDSRITWEPDTCLTGNYDIFRLPLPSVAAWCSTVHVIWDDNKLDGNDHIYYKRSIDHGASWEPYIIISNSPERWRASYASLAVWGQYVHVVWHEWSMDNPNSSLKYKSSVDAGTTWHVENIIASGNICQNCHPRISVAGSYVLLVWEEFDSADITCITKYKYSTDNGKNWRVFDSYEDNNYYEPNTCIDTMDTRPSDTETQNLEMKLQIHPNPFVSFARISTHEQENFVVYDVSGRHLGIYKGNRIGADLSPGVYFLKGLSKNSAPVRIIKVN